MRRSLLLCAALALLGCAAAPNDGRLPETDVFLVEITSSGGLAAFHRAINVTARAGYDNQPAFSADGRRLLFSSVQAGQADLWAVDLGTRASERVTLTLESEYSPLPVPGSETLAFVRVERDGRQRLWGLEPGGPFARPLLARPDYVGYHAWVDAHFVALFVLGEPSRLVLADRRDGSLRELAQGAGRSLQRLPGGGGFSYVEIEPSTGEGWIVELRLPALERRRIAPLLGGSQDHAWSAQGELWMARGSALFAWKPGGWEELGDFAADGVAELTRIAVSPDGRWIAMAAVPVR